MPTTHDEEPPRGTSSQERGDDDSPRRKDPAEHSPCAACRCIAGWPRRPCVAIWQQPSANHRAMVPTLCPTVHNHCRDNVRRSTST